MGFVIVSKVNYPEERAEVIQSIGLQMLGIMRTAPGNCGVALHQSVDKSETMMYSEWKSESDYLACMKSEKLVALMEQSHADFAGTQFFMETYTRLD